MSAKVLIVDDEVSILELLEFNLQQDGYEVLKATNGLEAIEIAKKFNPDLIILDIMMPYKDGVATCNVLRSLEQFDDTIIIFLTAMSDEDSEIAGLNAGADDYMTKPIKMKILKARVLANLKRKAAIKDGESLVFGDLIIDRQAYQIKLKDEKIMLARKEFELLLLLASKPGHVLDRQLILNNIWGTEVIVGDRTIDVHIRKIRQKLNDRFITTVKGVGYKFEAE
jgi:two-component system, OmpR family, alkaline phosphatase synthesis response regulator PhoP